MSDLHFDPNNDMTHEFPYQRSYAFDSVYGDYRYQGKEPGKNPAVHRDKFDD